ncbi:hypothetical protein PF005_g26857 [Phytophthora fragariae]|uniref:RxLR effector protein n=1 Tax=Phytophthora fragariae TaxID=53985 RepID=A0A6A3HTA2_9STRA|nr:hypothetical protein PF003_g36883 [Phytophthora fragariae]KAE8922244.1 hypothetical protein PF009_g27490 [Phytophthora fragariae]KAE8972871.1 hypothetical protein PF011_g25483 [Phytophthora fragariae]KAE9085093.1 hypothetical protein PF006_g26332 [Phytophthora fragariae]KAE9112462.1 hypothetical protein PF007_g11099 [Phytophthora fragariae]
MRMQCLVLLVLVLFCAGSHAAEAPVRSEQATSSAVTTRLLRSHEAATVDDTGNTITAGGEERAPNGAYVSRLAEADRKVWRLRKFDMTLTQKNWLSVGKDPEYIFNLFHTNHNTWAKIDHNKKTTQWFRFVEGYRAKWGAGSFPDYRIYQLLRSKVPEAKLATVFQALKEIPDLKSLGETMQNYQLKHWVSRGETPVSVAKMLNLPHTSPLAERGANDDILSAFTTMFEKTVGL